MSALRLVGVDERAACRSTPPTTTRAGGRARRCAFHLDLHVDDVERFFADDEHEATCTGWIDCDGLGERMAIAEGSFNLLVAAGGSRRREMRYRLFAHDRAGRPVTLAGFKEVEDGWFRDTWVDTTTLFTRLYAGAGDARAGGRRHPAGHRRPARLRRRLPGAAC